MKRFIAALLALCVILPIAGCSGEDLSGFIKKTEGDWYAYGNSADRMLSISEDGAYEIHSAKDDAGDRERQEWGNISYDTDNKTYILESSKGEAHTCKLSKDGVISYGSDPFVPAEESRDFYEWFYGGWYVDGDRDKDYYTFSPIQWQFYQALYQEHYSPHFGYSMIYRGGKNKTLTLIDRDTGSAFVNFIITGDDKICTKTVDGNETFHTFYERLDSMPDNDELRVDDGRSMFEGTSLSRDDSWFDNPEETGLVIGNYYYLNGDTGKR